MNTHAKHPKTLSLFFATEMWERYGFYVVQTLLAIYLTQHFGWNDDKSYVLVGSFTALTYISPVVGGWLADHLIGQKRAILSGAVILLLNYLILSFYHQQEALLIALAGIAVGTGLLKPNISSLLGNQYPTDSRYKDSGFTIFYMGITSGIILGTTIPSQLQRHFGWSSCFLSAAFGILLALLIFSFGISYFKVNDYSEVESISAKNYLGAANLTLLLWGGSYLILHSPQFAGIIFIAVAAYSAYFILKSATYETGLQRTRTYSILLLCIISILFWSFYFQMFLSLTLLITRAVEHSLFGFYFPAPYYVAIQSLGIIVFGLFFTMLWARIKPQLVSRSSANKFFSAMVVLLAAYLLILLAISHSQHLALISPTLIISAYLLISIAELLLSPVGLSAITTLANPGKVSTMMGIFFVSLGLGGYLSGILAKLTAINESNLNLAQIKHDYLIGFSKLTIILFICTIISLFINICIKRITQKHI